MTGLSITGLRAEHGRNEVLTGLDLVVEDGALACVLGPSGCGKSTLLRVIAGFHRPTAGAVELRGRTLADQRTWVPAERRRIGYMPQDGALFPHLTIAGNIGFGLPRAARRGRVAELLELVGLAGLGERHPHQLSGGQQQRVALARALAPAPELLLLDEPFAALDAALRADLRAEVAATLRAAGATAILVTHDQDEALSFADLIAVVRGGRIAQTGTPDELYHRPADPEVARTLGEANLVAAELDGETGRTAFGPLPLTAAGTGSAQVLLRPGQLRLDEAGAVAARVLRSHFRGHDHRVELSPEPGRGLPERLIAYTDTAPPPAGSPVRLAATGPAHAVGGGGAGAASRLADAGASVG
ncbi:ABC transporter ATP-binding protein [Kitasatospora viridis]|uniref:ABC-type quaternary amine transporter n=1 Tax=Kitasatospora viridis TaxID=281105 RepID=A0A561UNT0_9ACTN|nr:ABC transporter ATP-binding protein [Kitasatospora viridis]TWG01012.1 iron(III) transport system ATP-binding protein [Kitasatospora viridis]